MFKKRPRNRSLEGPSPPGDVSLSKLEPGYWMSRLFKNTFTYKGRSREVKGWSIKIQLFGKRKTFALSARDRPRAADEACNIYRTILTQGWDAVEQRRGKAGVLFPLSMQSSAHGITAAEFSADYWSRRLIHRPYPRVETEAERELSVRIEHAGTSRYFPLRTNDEEKAASAAARIYRTVVERGWAVANQGHPRELTVALRWLDDPLAWTYATFHTWISGDPTPAFTDCDDEPAARSVAVVEPDASIRYALAACASRQNGFRCCGAYANAAEAAREIARQRTDLVLANYALPDQPGSAFLEGVRRVRPTAVGLLFSIFEDSDQLFKSTPGGARGYLLKRTPAHHFFDPIAETPGPLSRELVAARLREYFQRVIATMPSGPSALDLAGLTPREHEILALLAKGDLAKNIADLLGISIWTVHGHVKSIFEKLGVHSRTEAVIRYLQK